MYIKSLTKIQEFESSLTGNIVGVYEVQFDDDKKYIVVRNGDILKAVIHGLKESTLNKINDEVANKIIDYAEGY